MPRIGLQLRTGSDIIFKMKAIRYTRHARNRMRQHRITEAEVKSCLEAPEYCEPSSEGRLNAWVGLYGKFLRVTYREDEDGFLVITAVKKKKRWR
jgi:hypothetical protein